MEHTTIAVDLAKSVFQVAISHTAGRVDIEKRLTRDRFLAYLAQQPPATVLLEACGSSHYWARQIQPFGHVVRLLPAHDVHRYRTGQGKTWRVHHVSNVRYGRQLPNYRHTGEWLTLEATALELGVSNTVIKRLIAEGVLPATHVVEYAPWVITRTDLQRPAVQARIQAVHHGHKLPRLVAGQEQLPLKSDSL